MIEGHRWLGFSILGGVLASLLVVAALILHAGGGVSNDVSFQLAPSAAGSPAPATATLRTRRVAGTGVDPAWAARAGALTGIPAPAMRAYGDAQLALARQLPGCHLSWNTLAGIGWIESQHGTLGGRTLLPSGYSSTSIVGPALDGTTYAAIRSTSESAAWHGDRTWEHAVGPLQFIASTWNRWGTDGNGDGRADPLDIDDAALTAGRYLCADDHDLSTASGWNAAVHSFNHDQQYVLNVLSAANTYAQRSVQGSAGRG